MDTNRIKRFATEARNKLKEGIAAKIRTLGFDKKGNVAEEHRPQLMQGGTHWNGQLLPETFYHQWTSLYNRIQQKGISEVYEEAATPGSTAFVPSASYRRTTSVLLCSTIRMPPAPLSSWMKPDRVASLR